MTAIRTWLFGIVAWGALAASATAAPLSWFGSQASLTAWYANQLNSAGNIYAPASSNTVSNVPANWYVATPSNSTVAVASSVAELSTNAAIPASVVAPTAKSLQVVGDGPTTLSATDQAAAFVNFGSGSYADASTLTVGTPGPWYNSGAVSKAFGGVPNDQQRADFVQSVLAKVEHTFQISGMDLNLTSDPQAPASHMMSVVSGASYGPNPDAVGITNVGSSGFSFIDKLAYANNPDQLAWAVAHNVAHELMHALGVATHPDATGGYLDAARADWNSMINPDTKFSPEAVEMMKSATTGVNVGGLGLQLVANLDRAAAELSLFSATSLETPVPEPSTVAVWTLAGLFAGFSIRRRFAGKEAA